MQNSLKTLSLLILAFVFLSSCQTEKETANIPITHQKFQKMGLDKVTPEGWIKEFLERQKEGLTGNIEVAGYPYNTCMWGCEKMKGSTKAWWPYEQTAYYLDGAHRLGILLDAPELVRKATQNMEYVKAHIEPSGRFGTNLADRWWRWPYASFNRLFMVQHELTGDDKILEILDNHYSTFEAEDFQDDLDLANVEQLCWLFGKTGDSTFIAMAEKAYTLFNENPENKSRAGKKQTPSDMQFGTDRIPDHHGVVYLELAKIPTLLYQYTGKEAYLREAENALAKMEKHFMIVQGLPSTTEHFEKVSETAGFEVCNTATLPYTYGELLRTNGDALLADKIERAIFNGALGAISKDFKTHQYFSEANQVLATPNSNRHGHHPSRTAYLPGHDVECCTGNVNRFMPYYVEQMWLKTADGHGLAASLYGASSIETVLGESSKKIKVAQKTNYPFSEKISFEFNMEGATEFPFLVRIPEWTSNPSIKVNGEALDIGFKIGSFATIDREFNDGDVVELTLPMSIKTTHWPNNGVAVERGPLVYSLPISAKKEVVEGYERSTEDFPAWSLTPKSQWQFGLLDTQIDAEFVEESTQGYPWDEGNSPIKIIVRGQKVKQWELEKFYDDYHKSDMTLTPAFPEELHITGQTEELELVPYGSTMLRLTVFPSLSANQ